MIYVFLAEGFEEVEALTTVDVLRRAGLSVSTVGVTGKTVAGSHGIRVTADIEPDEMDLSAAEAVMLPGGMPGTKNLEASVAVQSALDHAAKNDLWIAAICAAPSVLGHKGLLLGKRATCYPGFESELFGATPVADPVVVDGKIVTGKGPGVSLTFALTLVGLLCSPKTAAELRESMQCL